MHRQCPRGHRRGPCRSHGRQASSVCPTVTDRLARGPKPNAGTVGPKIVIVGVSIADRQVLRRGIVGHENAAPPDELRGSEQGEHAGGVESRGAGRGTDLRGDRRILGGADDDDAGARRELARELDVVRPAFRRPDAPGASATSGASLSASFSARNRSTAPRSGMPGIEARSPVREFCASVLPARLSRRAAVMPILAVFDLRRCRVAARPTCRIPPGARFRRQSPAPRCAPTPARGTRRRSRRARAVRTSPKNPRTPRSTPRLSYAMHGAHRRMVRQQPGATPVSSRRPPVPAAPAPRSAAS